PPRRRGVGFNFSFGSREAGEPRRIVTMAKRISALLVVAALCSCATSRESGTRSTATYLSLKKSLDAVPAIDTHDHVYPFDRNPAFLDTDKGRGVNLASLWLFSYFGWTNRLTPWTPGGSFDQWWAKAKDDFRDARATS